MIGPVPAPFVPGALEAATAGMAGMTADEAFNEFMDQTFDVSGDVHIGYTSVQSGSPPAVSGDTSNTIADSTNPVAVDAWNDYVENEVTTVSPTTGGVQDGSNVQIITYSILEALNNEPQAVTPVAIPMDVGIVAIAQALGVSMDAAELDVETRQAFANSIAQGTGTIYDAVSNTIVAWKDKLNNILFPQSAIDAIDAVIRERGIGGDPDAYEPPEGWSPTHITPPLVTSPGGYTYMDSGTPVVMYAEGDAVYVLYRSTQFNTVNAYLFSKTQRTFTYYKKAGTGNPVKYTYPGSTGTTSISRTRYYYGGPVGNYNAASGSNPVNVNNWASLDTGEAGTLLYDGVSGSGEYPEGTSQSEAPSYTPSSLTGAGSIVGDNGTRVPVVPINIPDDPYNSTGSTTDPQNPTDEDNPGVQNPPLPLPIPDTKPSNPSVPLVNPSVIDSTRVEELVEELANTLDPQPGQSSGIIPVPPLPGIIDPTTGQSTFPSIIPDSGPGFIHVYNPTPAEFVAFGTWLWVTYADATIDKILNNPFDGVIGAHELYATPNRGGRDNIRSAFLTCPTTADLVPNRYSEIDCGTVIVPEFYGNYLDYSPYSQAYIYLPFIGINEVSIDDIVGHAVNIRYRIDSYSGSCIAMIFVAKNGYQNLCYQFAGSCSVEVPMAGGSQAAIKAGMMQAEAYARAAMTSAAGHLLGGIGSALMGSLGGALSSIGGIANDYAQAKAGVEAARVANKSSVQHSGQFGASHGAMGQKIPFIIIRNPIQVKVVNYNDDYGFPAHKRVIIGGCTGYLRVREVNVISAHATDDEKAAIEALLKNGVYVS